MMDLTYTSTPHGSETSPAIANDAVHMLLAKLDEGTQTVINLRSILTLKTAELNELLAQLELTNQAITNVESTTSQIELMLREFGMADHSKESLLHAEASLDSAIKSATSIYPHQFKQQLKRRPSTTSTNSGSAMESVEGKRMSHARLLNTRIRYKPDTKHILRKLNDLLRDLDMDSGKFFATIGTTDDFEVLQKAYVDLDIAKTISLSAKSNMKRRHILIKSARRRNNKEEIQALGDKIREGVTLWLNYTRNTPLLIQGEDILTLLDREDALLAKNSNEMIHSYSNETTHPKRSSLIRPQSFIDKLPTTTKLPSDKLPATTTITTKSPVDKSTTTTITTTTTKLTTDKSSTTTKLPVDNNNNKSSTTTNNTIKKPIRTSTGPRLTQVKASIGLPRVRTTSITQQQQQPKEPKLTTPPNSLKESLYRSTRPTHIPLPTNLTPPTPISTSTSSSLSPENAMKKSMLKKPAERGPGSTLRLRSMLAKRGTTKQ